MSVPYSVSLDELVRSLKLPVLYRAPDYDTTRISVAEVNRPALQLTGFYDFFDPKRIQIIGKIELTYLAGLSGELRRERLEQFFSSGVRVVVISHVDTVDEIPLALMNAAIRNSVNLLMSHEVTSVFMGGLIVKLHTLLAPRTTVHGVLMEICGEGVLICGESGVGKSETAMALLRSGHRLVADDAVEIRKTNPFTLMGSAPEMIRYFMEVRGIGVVDARHLFGIGAVKPEQRIDLVVQFELWDDAKNYDRLGLDNDTREILGVKLPLNTIPVRPGRNLAAILELAAMNNREKKMGYDAAQVLVERYNSMIDEG